MELSCISMKLLLLAAILILRWKENDAAESPTATPVNSTRSDASSSKQLIGNVYSGYYDFTVTEISAKVWAVCMVVSISILIYAAFLSTIMAKLKGLNPEGEEDYFKKRSVDALSTDSQTVATVLRSIHLTPRIAGQDAWLPSEHRKRR